jgi:hypothetical protein
MSACVKLSATGDWDLTGGKGALVTGDDFTAQKAATALRLELGEDRYDVSKGFPWLSEIYKGKLPPNAFGARVRDYLLALPTVDTADVKISLNTNTRQAEVVLIVNDRKLDVTI